MQISYYIIDIRNNYLLQSSSTSHISFITYTMIYYIIYYFIISYHFIENNISYNLPLLCVHPPGHRLRCPQRSKHRWIYMQIRDIENQFFQPFIGSVTSQWALMSVCWLAGKSGCYNLIKGRKLHFHVGFGIGCVGTSITGLFPHSLAFWVPCSTTPHCHIFHPDHSNIDSQQNHRLEDWSSKLII